MSMETLEISGQNQAISLSGSLEPVISTDMNFDGSCWERTSPSPSPKGNWSSERASYVLKVTQPGNFQLSRDLNSALSGAN